jgi:hypothetical protein
MPRSSEIIRRIIHVMKAGSSNSSPVDSQGRAVLNSSEKLMVRTFFHSQLKPWLPLTAALCSQRSNIGKVISPTTQLTQAGLIYAFFVSCAIAWLDDFGSVSI